MDPTLSSYVKSRNPSPPPHFGVRYDAQGLFRPEPGNTVICHLVPETETERALIAARDRYRTMPEAALLAFTPISSLHMTLFQGIIESRRKPGFWPKSVPLETPIDEMTAIMGDALTDFPPLPAFAVKVVNAVPTGLIVEGATSTEQGNMAAWRDALADLWGYRHPDHESYVFHITFAYMIDWLPDAAAPAWQAMLDGVVADITARAPTLQLKPPAFCAFNDMNHFEELDVLRLSA